MKRSLLIATVTALLVAAVVVRWSVPTRSPHASRTSANAAPERVSDSARASDPVVAAAAAFGVAGSADTGGERGRHAPHVDRDAKPRSIRGTAVDGALVVDGAGRFVPTVDARRFFDYFLVATGEIPAPELRARIVAAIQERLAPDAAAAATALLDRYLQYRERTRALANELGDLDPATRLERLRRLRADVLGPSFAQALFGEDDAVQAVEAERQRVARDESRSADDRARAMVDLEARLPASEREARAEAMAPLQLGREESRLRTAGASPGEIRALRESYFGVDAAARLEQLDRAREEWDQRLVDYRTARAAIDADGSLSPDERHARATRLVDESFTPTERLRVDALDRIAHADSDASPQ